MVNQLALNHRTAQNKPVKTRMLGIIEKLTTTSQNAKKMESTNSIIFLLMALP